MDPTTVAVYDAGARAYCDEWLSQPPPEDLQALWQAHLIRGVCTLDVGSGSGRDADWLARHGFPCEGVDASAGLVAEARRRFPHLQFRVGQLPALDGVRDAAYKNVICETVIMHLDPGDLVSAVIGLRRVLAPGGVLYLSWRVGEAHTRDSAGRLYSAFPASAVREALAPLAIVYDREEISVSSGRRVHRIIARAVAV